MGADFRGCIAAAVWQRRQRSQPVHALTLLCSTRSCAPTYIRLRPSVRLSRHCPASVCSPDVDEKMRCLMALAYAPGGSNFGATIPLALSADVRAQVRACHLATGGGSLMLCRSLLAAQPYQAASALPSTLQGPHSSSTQPGPHTAQTRVALFLCRMCAPWWSPQLPLIRTV